MTLDMLGTAVASGGMPMLPTSMSDHMTGGTSSPQMLHPSMYSNHGPNGGMMSPVHTPLSHHPHHHGVHGAPMTMTDADTDPRELEAFAVSFPYIYVHVGAMFGYFLFIHINFSGTVQTETDKARGYSVRCG